MASRAQGKDCGPYSFYWLTAPLAAKPMVASSPARWRSFIPTRWCTTISPAWTTTMSDVPDYSIAGCIEHRMQRDRQLDDAESGADVSAGTRTDLDQAGAHFFRDCAQLVARHRLQIRWGVDAVEDGHSERGQDVRVTMKLATCDSSRVSNPCLRRLSRPSSINACAR